MKTWPYCREQVKDAAVNCAHCGRDIRPLAHRRFFGAFLIFLAVSLFGYWGYSGGLMFSPGIGVTIPARVALAISVATAALLWIALTYVPWRR